MAVRQIKQQSLVQKAADELARLIGDGEWPVGTKIPNEQDLSTLLGVGRSTGREAVRALIASGQLYSHQGSGTYVMSSTPVTELERELKRSDRREVYEVRRLLEVEAGRLAAMRRTSADVDLLQAALAARENASTPTEFVDADMELHRAVVNAAHNSVLSMVFDSFIETLRNSALDVITDVTARNPQSIDDEAAAHRDLVEAIVAGDADAASAATRRNMDGLD